MGDAILSAGFTIEVAPNPGTSFTVLNGHKSFKWGWSDTKADTTTNVSLGAEEHLIAKRGKTVTVECLRFEQENGARDPGQAIVEVLAEALGLDAIGGLRITSPGGVVKSYLGSFSMTDGGGSNDDPAAWAFEFTRSGPDVA